MLEVQSFRNKLEQQKGQKMQIEKSLFILREELRTNKRLLRKHEEAREIIKAVGIATQNQISFHISDITSLALEAVFDNPYQLEVEFVQRRNKTECDLYFVREGEKVDPLTASGGGTVDIASFALRIASWSMMRPHSRNTIILDEPFKHLSDIYQNQASAMVKELSKKLNLQFIIVTHKESLTSFADKIFNVSIKNGKSKVTEEQV